jgi:hypothetical protein
MSSRTAVGTYIGYVVVQVLAVVLLITLILSGIDLSISKEGGALLTIVSLVTVVFWVAAMWILSKRDTDLFPRTLLVWLAGTAFGSALNGADNATAALVAGGLYYLVKIVICCIFVYAIQREKSHQLPDIEVFT